MWRIGGGCGPNWTSAGKRGVSNDASVVTPPNSSANLRNAVSTRVCQPRKKLGWQTWVERSVVPVEFACPLVKSQGFDPKNRGKSKLSTQVCQPSPCLG